MDWDEVRLPAGKAVMLGEPLAALSIGELEERIAALQAEIVRVAAEIEAKRRQAAAADAFFKS